MKHLILILTLLFIINTGDIYAQQFSYDYGKVTEYELSLNSYEKDNTAEAFVIYNLGDAEFVEHNYGILDIQYTYKTKIKILSKSGYGWGEIEIPLYNGDGIFEQIKNIEAFSYNYENGTIIKTPLDSKNIFKDKYNDEWILVKFAIPNIKEGTVVEYKYDIISPYKFKLKSWYFQKKIPVKYSKFRIGITPFYNYQFIVQEALNYNTFKVNSFKKARKYHFGPAVYSVMINEIEMTDIPAFKDESFITSYDDYIAKVDFQLSGFTNFDGHSTEIITTWDEFSKELLEHDDFGKYINKVEKTAKSDLKLLEIEGLAPENKVDRIVEFIKKNYRWNYEKDKFASKKAKEFIIDKHGNSADVNLYLTALLKAAKIETYPVIISTRDHGKIKYDYPFSHFFNYVLPVVKINNSYILLDGTDKLVQNNRIPAYCINDKGLLIEKDESKWIKLMYNKTSITNHLVKMELIGDDSLKASCKIVCDDYDALKYRYKLAEDKASIEDYLSTTDFMRIESIETKNKLEKEKPLEITYNAYLPTEVIGNFTAIHPFLFLPISENVLKFEERKHPIDMINKKSKTFYTEIQIPKGYNLHELPKNISIDNSLVKIIYSAEKKGEKVKIFGEYSFKKAIYVSTDYKELKNYFNIIVERFNEKIILSNDSIFHN